MRSQRYSAVLMTSPGACTQSTQFVIVTIDADPSTKHILLPILYNIITHVSLPQYSLEGNHSVYTFKSRDYMRVKRNKSYSETWIVCLFYLFIFSVWVLGCSLQNFSNYPMLLYLVMLWGFVSLVCFFQHLQLLVL